MNRDKDSHRNKCRDGINSNTNSLQKLVDIINKIGREIAKVDKMADEFKGRYKYEDRERSEELDTKILV